MSRAVGSRPGQAAAGAPPGQLRLEGVSKSFGADTVVDDLTLEVPAGSFFALVGPSGCGKTTTLRMVAGLEAPDRGRILVGGQDLTPLRPHERPVNTVFQNYALFPHLSVAENIAFGPKRRRLPREQVRREVTGALELVDLAGLGHRRPSQLSGGQQQRVALARALVNRPRVLLLDEPLGALDLKLRRQMQVELKRIQSGTGLTFVHVTHDQEEAMGMADTVAVMNQGRIEQLGAPGELYELPRSSFVANFLGRSNLAAATVLGSEGDLVVLDLAGHRIRVPRARVAEPGRRRALMGVRPEKVRLHTARSIEAVPAGTSNRITGAVVRDVSFLGVATQYLVELPGIGSWSVHEQNLGIEATARLGEQVGIAWDLRHSFTLPGDDDPTAGLVDDAPQDGEAAAGETAEAR